MAETMTAGGTDLVFEPFKPGPREQLPAVLAELRERFPVYRTSSDIWVISRFDDVKAVQSSPELFSSRPNPYEGDSTPADAEMKLAAPFSIPGDDYWTTVAEIAAMNGDVRGVNDALDHAAARKEPTASYVLANPLFGFLQSDARFQKLREKLKAQQDEIRSALAGVTI